MWSIKNYASVRVSSMKDRIRAFFAIMIILGSCTLSFYLRKCIFKEYSSFGDEIAFSWLTYLADHQQNGVLADRLLFVIAAGEYKIGYRRRDRSEHLQQGNNLI